MPDEPHAPEDMQSSGASLTARAEFLAGMRALAPILLGVIPSSIINGSASVAAGIPAGEVIAMSWLVFAGPAQLVIAQLYSAGAPVLVVILTAAVVNLRLLLYSLAVTPHLEHLPARWRTTLAYLITDPAIAVTLPRFQRNDGSRNKHWFFLGAGLTLFAAWQVGVMVGVFVGVQVPANWSLDFAIPLVFIAIVVPQIRDRALGVAVIAAMVTAIVLAALPFRLSFVAAAVAGVAAGVWAEAHR
jgi:predicted branched-subunit amino acid permease